MGEADTNWAGPGGLDGARSIATEVIVGHDDVVLSGDVVADGDGWAVACELADHAWLLQSIGRSHRRTADRLDELRRTPL